MNPEKTINHGEHGEHEENGAYTREVWPGVRQNDCRVFGIHPWGECMKAAVPWRVGRQSAHPYQPRVSVFSVFSVVIRLRFIQG